MSKRIKTLTLTAILVALSVAIPFCMPSITIPPAMTSTLCAHVPIFIACFISPWVALAVVLAGSYVFFLTRPLVIAARALSHVVFTMLLSLYFRFKGVPKNMWIIILVGIFASIIHAICEVGVVAFFFFPANNSEPMKYIWVAVGLGTFIHSMIDYIISFYIGKRLNETSLHTSN